MVSCFEDNIVLYTITEILYGSWFQFLVFDKYAETEKIEFPSSIYTEIISYFCPVLVQLVH